MRYANMREEMQDACVWLLAIESISRLSGGRVLAEYWLDKAICILCEDLDATKKGSRLIGDVLTDQFELEALQALQKAIETVGQRLGWPNEPERYFTDPDWLNVQLAAIAVCRRVLRLSG
jgi:hypothetical protein